MKKCRESKSESIRAADKRRVTDFLTKGVTSSLLDKSAITNLSNSGSRKFWNNRTHLLSDEALWIPKFSIDNLRSRKALSLAVLVNETKKNIVVNVPKPKQKLITVTRRLRIYPNKKQRELFKQYFDMHRFIYNKCVEIYRAKIIDEVKKVKYRDYILDILRNNTDYDKMNKLSYDSKDVSVKQFVTMYKSATTNKKRKRIHHFNLKFLSKKSTNMFCIGNKYVVLSNNKKQFCIAKNTLGNKNSIIRMQNKCRKWLLDNQASIIGKESKIIRDRDGKYYWYISHKCLPKQEPAKVGSAISLDPGERKFQTFYSQKEVGVLGDGLLNDLERHMFRSDRLEIKYKSMKGNKRRLYRKKYLLSRTKMTNITRDYHWKIAKSLVDDYETIIIPKFDTQRIIKKCPNKRVRRMLYALSHYSFRTRLEHSCKMNGRAFILCSEAFTSQTCGKCGITNDVGLSETYRCKCGLVIDRDINGARNIMLKTFSDYLNK
jgi:IS605 OrfB family transposase